MLIVLALGGDTLRLARLRDRLPGMSAGVLDHHVQQMTSLGLISRRRVREMPPRVDLKLTKSGRGLIPIAAQLARWGMRHVWFMPGDERVDIYALLRQLPALIQEESGLSDGTVETVLVSDRKPARHVFFIERGRLRLADSSRPTQGPTGRIEGDENAWTAALGPSPDYAGLQFTGRRELTRAVLDALPRSL
jgi:DNA-binding HxlR family transcriptional regulator